MHHYKVKVLPREKHNYCSSAGVVETTFYTNMTTKIIYLRKRSGLIMPIEPHKHNDKDAPDGVIVTRRWVVDGSNASKEFIAINKTLADVDQKIRDAIKDGLVRTRNGYMVTISLHITQADLDLADELYVDTLDVIIGKDATTLSPHPASERGIALTNALPDGRFILSVRIVSPTPNMIYYISCANGVHPIEAIYSPNDDAGLVTIYSGENKKRRMGIFTELTIAEALKGDKIKLFDSKEKAVAFYNGDDAKLRILELESVNREKAASEKLAMRDVEHSTKMDSLMMERQNIQQKGVVETIKLVPIIGAIFGLVAGLLGF